MGKEAREAVGAFKVNCIGVNPEQTIQPVEATVTINNDDTREVGCPYIGNTGDKRGNCLNMSTPEKVNCIHLYPIT